MEATSAYTSRKEATPFSIDDILSSSKTVKEKVTDCGSMCATVSEPPFFNPNFQFIDFPLKVCMENLNPYFQWPDPSQRLGLGRVGFMQPFWLTVLSNNLLIEDRQLFLAQALKGSTASKFPSNLSLNPNYSSFIEQNQKMGDSRVKTFSRSPDPSRPKKVREPMKTPGLCCARRVSNSSSSLSGDEARTEQSKCKSELPLNALEKLTCDTFKEMEDKQNILQAVVTVREAKMKRRKCRTAFSAFQLSVLEQRFNCRKYLTPTDRDQLAQLLNLSASQVITWFQNRRAKQKRDLEELKNDIKTVKTWAPSSGDKSSSPCSCMLSDDDNVEIDVEGS